jgi:hypothetical protein
MRPCWAHTKKEAIGFLLGLMDVSNEIVFVLEADWVLRELCLLDD